MIRVAQRFEFAAAHFLPLVADGHKCKRMHGHNYTVEIVCEGPLSNGMVIDFEDIIAAWKPLHEMLDHTLLNDHAMLDNPTCEELAAWLWESLRHKLPLYALRVSEGLGSWCEVDRTRVA